MTSLKPGPATKKRLSPDFARISRKSRAVSSTAPRRHITGTTGSIASAAQAASITIMANVFMVTILPFHPRIRQPHPANMV